MPLSTAKRILLIGIVFSTLASLSLPHVLAHEEQPNPSKVQQVLERNAGIYVGLSADGKSPEDLGETRIYIGPNLIRLEKATSSGVVTQVFNDVSDAQYDLLSIYEIISFLGQEVSPEGMARRYRQVEGVAFKFDSTQPHHPLLNYFPILIFANPHPGANERPGLLFISALKEPTKTQGGLEPTTFLTSLALPTGHQPGVLPKNPSQIFEPVAREIERQMAEGNTTLKVPRIKEVRQLGTLWTPTCAEMLSNR